MANYPIWKYHKTECPEGKIILSAEEDAALGKGWVHSPGFHDEPVKAETPVGATSDSPAAEAGPKVEAPQSEESKPVKSGKSKKD